MGSINNFNANSNVSLATTTSNDFEDENDDDDVLMMSVTGSRTFPIGYYNKVLSQALEDMKDGRCKRSNSKSLMDAFRKDLRDCKRSSAAALWSSPSSFILMTLMVFHLRKMSIFTLAT